MKNKIRILHVLGGMNRGGAETLVMNLYRNIDRTKFQFDFIVHTEKSCHYDDEIVKLGGRIYRVPRYKGKNHIQYKRAWENFFKEHPEYKIIHGHVRSTAAIYLKIAKKHGLKTIIHSHNTSSGKGFTALVKDVMQYPIRYISDYFFACSEAAGKWLFGSKVCKSKNYFIMNNAINTKEFIYNESIRLKKRQEFNIQNKLVIGHIGRFHPQKNHNFLIDIFKDLNSKNKNAVLMLVGDGELKPLIKRKVDSLGLNESVIFTGVRSDIPMLLQAMDAFVFPSIHEGLPVTLVEAQASGLPCFISDNITTEVMITNSVKRISLKKSPEEWTKEIFSSLKRHQRRNMSSEIIRAGYDIESVIKWYQEFCLNLINA